MQASPNLNRAPSRKIATNRCLTAIGQRGRRELPAGVTPGTPATEISWLEPYPDISPEAHYLARESVELAAFRTADLTRFGLPARIRP
jgi:RNA polymerase sigma-70 factor (ECF subfamily)